MAGIQLDFRAFPVKDFTHALKKKEERHVKE
jgi:hypothetical protein